MSSTTTGKCLCGQITVSLPQDVFSKTENIGICHCKNCRQVGGSLGSINLVAPDSSVDIQGQPKVYEDKNTGSGKPVQRAFCGNCGSPVYAASCNMPGVKVIKLGLFDHIPKPGMEGYCKDRPQWLKGIDGVKEFQTMP